MKATKLQPPIIIGDTLKYLFTFVDTSGVASDVTGQSVRFTLKTSADIPDSGALINVSVTGSGGDAVAGNILVVVSSTLTDALTPGTFWYHFERTSGSEKTTLAFGPATVINA
jgi:hypothetical protein